MLSNLLTKINFPKKNEESYFDIERLLLEMYKKNPVNQFKVGNSDQIEGIVFNNTLEIVLTRDIRELCENFKTIIGNIKPKIDV